MCDIKFEDPDEVMMSDIMYTPDYDAVNRMENTCLYIKILGELQLVQLV